MKMTDETLSAFLDNELTDAEMEAVRDQIEKDPTLADRLAEMASVDAGGKDLPECCARAGQCGHLSVVAQAARPHG